MGRTCRCVEQSARVATSADVINEAGQAIVFCRTRHGADRLARQLTKRGVPALAIHGGHAQNRRNRALERFANSEVRALVATDVAARGIHVDGVAAVVHYDPPADHKDYIHRSGRTARAGRTGLVVSLVQPDQIKDTARLRRQLGLRQDRVETGATDAGTAGAAQTEPAPRPDAPSRQPPNERSARRRGRGRGRGRRRRNSRSSARRQESAAQGRQLSS